MADMISGGPIANYYTGFTPSEKFRYDNYADQASQWLNELRLGQLNTDGMKQRIWSVRRTRTFIWRRWNSA